MFAKSRTIKDFLQKFRDVLKEAVIKTDDRVTYDWLIFCSSRFYRLLFFAILLDSLWEIDYTHTMIRLQMLVGPVTGGGSAEAPFSF